MVTVSANFKKRATRAIGAIVLFMIVYIILVVLGVLLAALCCYAGINIIMAMPGILSIALGVGLAGMGVLVFIFLIKFVFAGNETDRSHMVEITDEDEPRLLSFINDLADKVATPQPHKVYLSADVNASVFYDSSFWSMFLPENKNLTIGLGLINTITVDEFRGILAHEFGHFSQRSMKVGSYVYNVNRVIFNMLFENDTYGKLVQ